MFANPERTGIGLKVLTAGKRGPVSNASYPLPIFDKPGEWLPTLNPDDLKLCRYGYHCTSVANLPRWLTRQISSRLFVVQLGGACYSARDKYVCSRMRFLFEVRLPWVEPNGAFNDRVWQNWLVRTGVIATKFRGVYPPRMTGVKIVPFLGLDEHWERALALATPREVNYLGSWERELQRRLRSELPWTTLHSGTKS